MGVPLRTTLLGMIFLVTFGSHRLHAADPWLTIPGSDGPGKGKHIVSDQRRRRISLRRSPAAAGQDPGQAPRLRVHRAVRDRSQRRHHQSGSTNNIPGLEALEHADLMIIFTRFRDLPDEQMKHIVDYVESGQPIVGMRTATHAFDIKSGKTYARYQLEQQGMGWRLRPAGAGRNLDQPSRRARQAEHARHDRPGPGGPPDPARHPGRRHLGADRCLHSAPAVARRLPAADPGSGAGGHAIADQPATGKPERSHDAGRLGEDLHGRSGKPARVFTTTMGASQDLLSEGLRRLLVNACYWSMGLEDKISPDANVQLVGDFQPLPFGFRGFAKGRKPADWVLK